MSDVVLYWGVLLSQLMLAAASVLAMIRLVWGPRAQDRVVGFDLLYLIIMILFVTFAIRSKTTAYFEAALVIGLLGFVSSAVLAKFLMRGEVIE